MCRKSIRITGERIQNADISYRTIIEVIVNDLIKSEDVTETSPQQDVTTLSVAGGSHQHVDNGSSRHNDLVLEDTVDDGVTLVGEGKAGILDKQNRNDEHQLRTREVLLSSGHKKHRVGGLSGPVSSSLSDRQRGLTGQGRIGQGLMCQGRPARTRSAKKGSIGETSDCPFLVEDSLASDHDDLKITASAQERKTTASYPRQKPSDIIYSNEPATVKNMLINKTLDDILSADPDTRLKSVKNSLSMAKQETIKQFRESGSETKSEVKLETNKKSIKGIESLFPGNKPNKRNEVSDLDISDIDDADDELNDLHLCDRIPIQEPSFVVETEPINIKMAVELKTLILGSAQKNFSAEWSYQSFTFCDLPKIKYGLVQKKGGPCGIMASVQACLLQELLFANGHKPSTANLEPSRHERSKALAAALSTILWRCGSGTKAVVTLPGTQAHFTNSNRIKTDNLIELLMVNTLTSKQDLTAFITQNIRQFEFDGSSGVILTLYSAILSRTVQGVRQDMDEPSNILMGAHGYCTQEMVNLFLTGHAASNVFNDIIELDSGTGNKTLLKGIQCRSDIGFLSLYEHYKSCQVGTYYKTPKHSIWVVCSESHFSVLFSLKSDLLNDWKAERRFDLYYYDGLARQETEIRLTIDTMNKFFQAPSEDDLVPPLEHCIRTKWPDAEIDWNGTEPLL